MSRRTTSTKNLALVCILLGTASCSLPATRAELNTSDGCPQATKYRPIYVEGYFGVDSEKGISVDAGYEAMYPYAKFTFSSEPGAKTKLQVNVLVANQGNNGPERTSRTELPLSRSQSEWPIYDSRGVEISFRDRVRSTGFMIDPCVFKVEKIETL